MPRPDAAEPRPEVTDYLDQLGALALASRLRRLLGRLTRDGSRVYAELDIEFEVRWFPVLHLLDRCGARPVTEIARALGLTHPAVVQVTGDLLDRGLLSSTQHETDRRRRWLTLTSRGRRLVARLSPIWDAFEAAGRAVATEGDSDLLAAITAAEAALERRSLFDRISDQLEQELR